jgi:hypothetical protein
VEPPAGIEPATPSLPWNHREPLCGPAFPQVTPDHKGQSYRFSSSAVMRSVMTVGQIQWINKGVRSDHLYLQLDGHYLNWDGTSVFFALACSSANPPAAIQDMSKTNSVRLAYQALLRQET